MKKVITPITNHLEVPSDNLHEPDKEQNKMGLLLKGKFMHTKNFLSKNIDHYFGTGRKHVYTETCIVFLNYLSNTSNKLQ